ncbi:Ribbon-helix-helix protein, copG family [Sulfobacillus thermosulfidooxidans DSM 9293]|uniref:Ribbon-helix-helix protein, copG family n=1 Tax=Sulfobacillus thermosulfidooxidans (strain DSM 9293 / VKM B-1269 / AT-1) TaxID=929705 RepID=A0A1W1WKR5_SULTA|nr:ribbon-helix-helix protein, CopG family [Sulfobacillus thermosulfidooxidans]SMC06904.1 Ribbon-helix-helix protein, copG family [Sulfobacillus thermosulfidooxidans DSM 9293]
MDEQVTLRLPRLLADRIDRYAEERKLTRSDAMRALLVSGLDREGLHEMIQSLLNEAIQKLTHKVSDQVAQTVLVAAGRSPEDAAAVVRKVVQP